MVMKIKTMLIFMLAFLAVASVSGAADEGRPSMPGAPFDITSGSLEATRESIVFTGNVKVIYRDITIDADRVELKYTGSGKGSDNIKSIVATGGVRLVDNMREARADKLVYEKEEDMIILTGNPSIIQDKNTVAGEVIKVYLSDDKVKVEGSVKALINPETLKDTEN